MNDTIFVYHNLSEDRFLALPLDKAKEQHEQLKEEGWVHTTTLATALWVAELLNSNPSEWLRKIENLKTQPR